MQPHLDLSWNPDGSAFFRFQDGRVSSAVGKDGGAIAAGSADPILGATVTTPTSPPTSVAKIVDLDQQTITKLYGVVVTVALLGAGGYAGRMAIAELRDLWSRVGSLGGDEGAMTCPPETSPAAMR